MSEAGGPDDHKMPLLDHLIELRQRMLYMAIVFVVLMAGCYIFAAEIFQFLVKPLADILEGQNRRLIFTALHEAFFTYLKLAAFGAAFFGMPYFLAQIWLFVAPGLYRHEKRAFMPFLIATPVLFLLGASLVYFVVMPLAYQFFLGFEFANADGGLPIELEAKVDQYLWLSTRLILAFGLCFELPVLITLMARAGLVSSQTLAEKRRYAIVIAFLVGAILTPPDVISQVFLALPVLLLYEISILCARWMERAREEPDDAALA